MSEQASQISPAARDLPFEVINLRTGTSHGSFESIDLARGRVTSDGLSAYQIWFTGRWAEEIVEERSVDEVRVDQHNAGARIADDRFCSGCGRRSVIGLCGACQ